MSNFSVTVAIPTYNRSQYLPRAIRSVKNQDWPNSEIVVIDDASTDDTAEVIRKSCPDARIFRHHFNQGASVARNTALTKASNEWIIVLDDDDILLPGSIGTIAARLGAFQNRADFPVFQFAHGNGEVKTEFAVIKLADYLSGALKGEFLPVIQRQVFLRHGLRYPSCPTAGEHLLWWEIAEKFGIPTWADRVGEVRTDAPNRLTSPRTQVLRAREHAELQELTIAKFGQTLSENYEDIYLQKVLGAATYRLLSGDRTAARRHLRRHWSKRKTFLPLILWPLTFFPSFALKGMFIRFREAKRA